MSSILKKHTLTLKPADCVVFWGDGSVCSNFHGAEYKRLESYPKVAGDHKVVLFKTVEHDYMYHKAMYFKDYYRAEKIRTASTPAMAKRHGREVRNFNERKWNAVKETVMFQAKLAQAHNYDYILNYYVKMQHRTFIEASPYDGIWGVRMAANDPDIYTPSKWRGKNLLGKICGELAKQLAQDFEHRIAEVPLTNEEIAQQVMAFAKRYELNIEDLQIESLAALTLHGYYHATKMIVLSVDEPLYKRLTVRCRTGELHARLVDNPKDRFIDFVSFPITIVQNTRRMPVTSRGVPTMSEAWPAFNEVMSDLTFHGVTQTDMYPVLYALTAKNDVKAG